MTIQHTDKVRSLYPDKIETQPGSFRHSPTQSEIDKARPMLGPPIAPTPDELYEARFIAGLSRQDAATRCGVTMSTWKRWEKGTGKIPRATWGWFLASGGDLELIAGKWWAGWRVFNGCMVDLNGDDYHPGDLRNVTQLYQLRAALQARIRKLEASLAESQQRAADAESGISETQQARGQLDAVGLLVAILHGEFERSDNLVLRRLAGDLYEVMKSAGAAQAKMTMAVTK